MYITLLVLLIITLSSYHKTKKAPVVIQHYKTFLQSIIPRFEHYSADLHFCIVSIFFKKKVKGKFKSLEF